MLSEFKRLAILCDQRDQGIIDDEILLQAWPREVILDRDLADKLKQRNENRALFNKTQSEKLLVQLEILAGLESPAESQQTRMAYQVERLNRELSMGQKETRTQQEQVELLVIEWYCQPAKPQHFQDRFNRAALKLGVL